MKGVKITSTNRSSLGHQYGIDPDDFDDLLPLGYILISEFSAEYLMGVVTQQTFDATYNVGDPLQNDYFVVIPIS